MALSSFSLKTFAAWATNKEHGMLTTHFWGPVANWGLVVSAVYDASFSGPEVISLPMTGTLVVYSSLFMRFAWLVQPRNYLLFACHSFNVTAQLNQLRRGIQYKLENEPETKAEITSMGAKAVVAGAATAAVVAFSTPLQKMLLASKLPDAVTKVVNHPAGPFHIHFWAPTFKWMLSVANLVDLERPTDKISLSQQTALTATGLIWSRYSMVINPVNYNLLIVNVALASSSGYHLARKVKAEYFSNDGTNENDAPKVGL